MFENMRIGSLYPPGFSNNSNVGDPFAEFNTTVFPYLRSRQEHQDLLNEAILKSQMKPDNIWAPPHTTNNEIPHGITPANPQLNTVTTNPQISPLDMAKLRQGQEKIDVSREKESTDAGIRQQRADIYDYKSKHPDHKFDFSGPTVKVADPRTGSVYDTGLDTGKLSIEDKLRLSSQLDTARDTNRINTQGNVNASRDLNKHLDTLGEISARGDETRKTNAAKPNTKTTSNTQINQGYINKAQELSSDPNFGSYIKLNRNQDGKIVGFSVNGDPNDPIYHQVNSKIYGSGMGDVTVPSDSSSDNKNPSFNSSTTKRFKTKNGTYDIPMDKLDSFKKDNPDAQEVESR